MSVEGLCAGYSLSTYPYNVNPNGERGSSKMGSPICDYFRFEVYASEKGLASGRMRENDTIDKGHTNMSDHEHGTEMAEMNGSMDEKDQRNEKERDAGVEKCWERYVVCVADGCNWGEKPMRAARDASRGFCTYLQTHQSDIVDVRTAAHTLLKALEGAQV